MHSKGKMFYDYVYITLLKLQNYGNEEKINDLHGLETEEWQSGR